MANKIYQDKNSISENYSRKLISGKVTATEGVHSFGNFYLSYGSVGSNRFETLKAIQKENKFKLIWYIIFVAMGIACLIIEPKGWFNVLDLFIVMINVDLVSRGKVVGIYIGLFECLMYIYICSLSGLYGEILKISLINIPLNIVAIISWTKNLKKQKNEKYNKDQKSNEVVIRKLHKKNYFWIIPVMIVLYVGFYFGLRAIGTNALIFSTAALVLTVFSKILSGLRYKENYIFSLISGCVQALMWVEVIVSSSLASNLDLTELPLIVSSVALIVNDIQGYSLWKSMYRKIAINGGDIFAMRKINIKKIVKLRHTYQKLVWDKKIDVEKNS